MITFGIIGLLLISYAVWVKKEKPQDTLFIVGGIALLIYSIYVKDPIFIILEVIFVISASVELITVWKKKNKEGC